MGYRRGIVWILLGLAGTPLPAAPAETASLEAVADDSAAAGGELEPLVVTAQHLDLRNINIALDEARVRELLPSLGASAYGIDQAALDALPQGTNTPLDKVLLQAPGVSYDSAISNPDFHVRNEYANVQYRINGIQLPEGVSALGSVLETRFVDRLDLLDGALPAQYGLRTAGVIDLTSKAGLDPGGSVDLYAGSWQTVSPSIEYSGNSGRSEYFVTGRYLQSAQGLENAMPTPDPVHDRTEQEKLFGFGSTLLGESSRLTYLAGAFTGRFQIPDLAGQQPLGDYGAPSASSASLNENETDRFYFGELALQSKQGELDTQLSVFTRYASTDFVPDVYGDLEFNDVASTVVRRSVLGGLEFDAADQLGSAHRVRFGATASVERTALEDLATVLPVDAAGMVLPVPLTLDDSSGRLGRTAGVYLQDEWSLSPVLTLNSGLRFDALEQFLSAHQTSPRIALLYRPDERTTVHAGVSRYFTPPMQAQATPNDLALFAHTTQAGPIALADPVRPERATYYDLGIEQHLTPALTAGADVYYKRGTDVLDDGQFGQAVVLSQFNYRDGFSRGAELKVNYCAAGLRLYANASHEVTMAKDIVSNQYLLGDPLELAYMASRYTPTSDAQTVSASGGASYQWHELLASLDGIYGSGLHAGFANLEHNPQYTQWNAALARSFHPWGSTERPLALRLSVVNLFDRVYLLRAATGVGEFAPQYGPRRGIFLQLTQQF